VFCEKGKDSLEHYVRECDKVKAWFRELGCEDGEILEQFWREDNHRGKILRRLCRERRKRAKVKEKEKRQGGKQGE